MNKRIVINPLTRISGFLEIQVVMENNTIVDAVSSGLLFRGFENMLKGRPPLDAIYFTERICGICSTAHSMASTLALEDALQVIPDENDKMIRDFTHGCEFLQNHLRHFFQFTLPDFIKGPKINPLYPPTHGDFRFPESVNKKLANDYLQSIKYSRLAHEMLAIFGAKAPHNHGIFVGGITANLDSAKYIKVKSILNSIKEFVEDVMIEDVFTIAEYYPELYSMGTGYCNLMSYGLFDKYKSPELTYVEPKVLIGENYYNFDPDYISENIYCSWYKSEEVTMRPGHEALEVSLEKESAYSWIKAPRYDGYPMEVGPLARMWLSGEYTNGISAMDRYIARVLEVKKIITIMEGLLERVKPGEANQRPYQIPIKSRGVGLIDTTRGSLGHWLSILDQRLFHYDIITPTTWNLSSKDTRGLKGVVEQALIGTIIQDLANPVEIGRIVRSFDPCISCATHIAGMGIDPLKIYII